MKRIKVVKVGGKLLEDEKRLEGLCDSLAELYPECVVVHGGGTLVGKLAERLGIEVKMHEGRRITDGETLDLAVMLYGGLANKRLVAALRKRGVNGCGLSGCDMGVVLSHKRPVGEIDWGFVGDIDRVDGDVISHLLESGIMPILCAISYGEGGLLLNTNADTIASAVAVALSSLYEVELIFCFDKPGVLRDMEDESSVIPTINRESFAELKRSGVIYSGMLPKLENAFTTIDAGVSSVRLTDPDHLSGGTIIVK